MVPAWSGSEKLSIWECLHKLSQICDRFYIKRLIPILKKSLIFSTILNPNSRNFSSNISRLSFTIPNCRTDLKYDCCYCDYSFFILRFGSMGSNSSHRIFFCPPNTILESNISRNGWIAAHQHPENTLALWEAKYSFILLPFCLYTQIPLIGLLTQTSLIF